MVYTEPAERVRCFASVRTVQPWCANLPTPISDDRNGLQMADWKKAADYEFTDGGRPARWVWEFLRRNPEYIADYASIPERNSKALEKIRKSLGNGARLAFPAERYFGQKWRISGEAQDPADDEVPDFLFYLPEMPMPNRVLLYYEEPDEIGQADQLPGFAVLVFRLREDLEPQLWGASRMLNRLQEEQGLVPTKKNLKPEQFATYLRVLDAKNASASTKEMVQNITWYDDVANKTGADWQYQAQKRIGRDHKKAKGLVHDPWSILR